MPPVISSRKLTQIKGFDSRIVALPRYFGELIGSHDDAVQPVNMSSALDAAHHAHVGPVDLNCNIADEIFQEAKGVRQFRFYFQPSHYHFPQQQRRKSARGYSTPACAASATKFGHIPHPQNYVFLMRNGVFATVNITSMSETNMAWGQT